MLNVFTRIFQSDMDLWIILVVQSGHIFILCWHMYAVIVNMERPQDVVLQKRLNIQEAHAFSTLDGYSVAVFVVGGWPNEETERLKHVLTNKTQKLEQQPSFTKIRTNVISKIVSQPLCGSNAWEIDAASFGLLPIGLCPEGYKAMDYGTLLQCAT